MGEQFGKVVGVPGALQRRQLLIQDPPNSSKSPLASSCGREFLGEPWPPLPPLQNTKNESEMCQKG